MALVNHSELAKERKTRKDYPNMIKYCEYAIKDNNIDAMIYAMIYLGKYYHEQKKYEKMIECYLIAIKKENADAMNHLGNYYDEFDDNENAEKYYKMAIEKGHIVAMFNLGFNYKSRNNYKDMIIYFVMSAEKGDYDAAKELGNYYENISDCDRMMKFYEMAFSVITKYPSVLLTKYRKDTITELINNYVSKLEDDACEKMYRCRKYLDVNNFKRLNNIFECCICFEKKEQLLLHCGHMVCFICYDQIDKCPLCRVLIY